MKCSPDQQPPTKHNPLDIQTADIRAQVGRIIGSPEFAQSLGLRELPIYIVDELLAGRARHIKGFTIGRAVFSAGEDFDPEANSIVRVEPGAFANALRNITYTPVAMIRLLLTFLKARTYPDLL